MGAKPQPRSLKSYVRAVFKPVARTQQRNTSFPLEMSLRSGRIAEHRQAAAYLAAISSQQERTDIIVRALILHQAVEELSKRQPEILEKCLEDLIEDPDAKTKGQWR